MKDEEIINVPIYFKTSENLYIGKCSTKLDKSSYKFDEPKPQNTPNTISKYIQKEFNIINRDKAKQKIFYRGSKFPQDSNYILMKYNSDAHSIQMCPSNEWINFIQSINRQKEDIKEIEEKNKEKQKEINKNIKEMFNFQYFSDMKQSENPKKKTRKRKTLLPNENEDIDDEENDKRKNNYNFDEDSHSSENNLEFEELEEDENEKRKKEEEEMKKLKEEEAKKKQKEKSVIDEDEEDEDDDSYNHMPSDVDENDEETNVFLGLDLLNKKRKREKLPNEDMKEELVNLFRKKNKMTYDEISEELIKKFSPELVGKYLEKLVYENTKKFMEGNKAYYFLLINQKNH